MSVAGVRGVQYPLVVMSRCIALVSLASAVALLASCGGGPENHLAGPERPRRTPPVGSEEASGGDEAEAEEPSDGPEHVQRIDDAATWAALAAQPDAAVFARTEVVKFMIDLEDASRLYFVDTHRFEIHYDFARARLHSEERPVPSHAIFNVREYRTDVRRFVCGTVVHYLDADLWAFEMIAGDNLAGDRVLKAFEQVKGAVYFGDQLRYRPLSDLHRRQIASVAARLPITDTDALLEGIRYQPLTRGVAFGKLRIVRGALDPESVRRDEIVVAEEVPVDLPLAMGLVTGTLQAPLAHVAILSQNRGTPNMAFRGAHDDARFTALDGQLVRLQVGPQDFTVRAATVAEAEAAWEGMRPPRLYSPPVDTTVEELTELCDLDAGDVPYAGAKAAQLAEVCAIHGLETPGGFVIPFYHYVAHLRRHQLHDGIEAMLGDDAFRRDRGVRSRRLAEIRTIVGERLRVDPALVRAVHRKIRAFPRGRSILRSSTNAEDLVGFNGAGLYQSVVLDANPSRQDVENAIREVWASVWTLRGFEEREFYRIDHRRVAMAILAQPFVGDTIANGVAITRNPFNEHRPGVFINVQTRAGSVTSAGDDIPEQHIVYTYPETPEPEVLTRSSLNGGQPILEEADVLDLTGVLMQLHARMAPRYPEPANAVDVEFLVTRDKRIVVVQVRPYTVTY